MLWMAVLAASLLPSLIWPDWRSLALGAGFGGAVSCASFFLLRRFSAASHARFARLFGTTLVIHGTVFAALVVLTLALDLNLLAATAPYAIAASGGLIGIALFPDPSPSHVA